MRHLVGKDHRQLGLALEAGQEPGVDVDPAVGQRERAQRRVANDRHPERAAFNPGSAVWRELLDNPGQIRVETRVVVEPRPRVDLRRLFLGLGPELRLGLDGRLAGGHAREGARSGEQGDQSEAAGASRQAIVQFFSASV